MRRQAPGQVAGCLWVRALGQEIEVLIGRCMVVGQQHKGQMTITGRQTRNQRARILATDSSCLHSQLTHLHFGVGGGPQQHKLRAPLQRAPGGVLDEVDPLLMGQPRHHAHHGHI